MSVYECVCVSCVCVYTEDQVWVLVLVSQALYLLTHQLNPTQPWPLKLTYLGCSAPGNTKCLRGVCVCGGGILHLSGKEIKCEGRGHSECVGAHSIVCTHTYAHASTHTHIPDLHVFCLLNKTRTI